MTPEEKFALCLMAGRAIVAAYRAEAPAGCDPQNSYVAIAGTVISVGAGVYNSSQQSKAAKKASSAQSKAGEGINFGEKPKAAEYKPVDFTQEQMNTIQGNLKNVNEAGKLSMRSNAFIDSDTLARARKFIPNYDENLRLEGLNTNNLLNGRLPYDDVLGIAANRNNLSNSLGTPGASTPATLRDLGLSRLDAIKAGTGMMNQIVNMAETINPVGRRMVPQDMYLKPIDRISASMQQNQLIQQSDQNKYNIEAGLSPTEQAQAQLGLNAQLNGGGGGGGNGQMVQSILSGLGSIAGTYAKSQAGQSASSGLMDSGFYSSPSQAAAAYGYGGDYQPYILKNPSGSGFYSPYSIPTS